MDLGIETIGQAIRYPDALVTCTKFPSTERLAPNVVVVFEVLGPMSRQIDRIDKVREYAAVPSILRYIIAEAKSAGLLVLHRQHPGDPWTAMALTGVDALGLPEVGFTIPLAEFYEDVDFLTTDPDGS
jgi:Uma2 family endonuclease